MKIPILDKQDDIKKCFDVILEEQNELNDELMILLCNKNLSEEEKEVVRNRIKEESFDLIQGCIGILDKLGATKEDLEEHYKKLKGRGWKFKSIWEVQHDKTS